MWQTMIALLYPFSTFIFIRLALHSFASWAARPRTLLLVMGVVFAAFTFHSAWILFCWTATMPHWWILWLVVFAFAWILFKNLREIWQFKALRKKALGKTSPPPANTVAVDEPGV